MSHEDFDSVKVPAFLDTFKSREKILRTKLQEKPKSAKRMAQLASLLQEEEVSVGSLRNEDPSGAHDKASSLAEEKEEIPAKIAEAISLARRATEIAPHKPYGYVALSTMIVLPHSDRMEALLQAWNITAVAEPPVMETLDSHAMLQNEVVKLTLGVRLLLEPRQEEARHNRNTAMASHQHPSRRSLSAKELHLYQHLRNDLQQAWETYHSCTPSHSCETSRKPSETSASVGMALSRLEYRLGLFFRKKQPSHVYYPKAVHHLQASQTVVTDTHDLAAFWLGTLQKRNAPKQCPERYVIGLYSTFADRFDDLLIQKLDYQTPQRLREVLDGTLLVKQTQSFRNVVDLGCGTGLSGLAFSDLFAKQKKEDSSSGVVKVLGVDVSSHMIAKAQQRAATCYTDFLVSNITAALEGLSNDTIDLILACDVFCYIGDLSSIFKAVARCLFPGGRFCFSTERLEDGNDYWNGNARSLETSGYKLQSSGRYAHTTGYLRALIRQSDFAVDAMTDAVLRKNEGKDVNGTLCVLSVIS